MEGMMTAQPPEIGNLAPDFEALTDTGETVKLSDYRGQRVVLYFYPKDNTSGCTTQACSFRDNYPAVEEQNAVVLGVSPDNVTSHQKFKAEHNLPFTLLVDQDHTIAELYGVWGEKSMYGRKYMGIIRSHFVIDEEGRIVDARVKVRPADSAELALKALKDS
jgi:peroxiredoxin Q/BCP